jgi:malonate-semialdehyde dehydrogenase (acetylating) / methylmalonate-semialdehyde dehydrogenase
MWTFPIAVVMGNCFILKPSEKVPLTMRRVASLMEEAGFPPGVFGMVQGTKNAVQALIQHPGVRAVTFVGSSPVAGLVSASCRAVHKRCTSLGGAKNHLIALPDCDVATAASDICVSFAGCAGQRCMAASVLLTVGPHPALVEKLVQLAAALQVRERFRSRASKPSLTIYTNKVSRVSFRCSHDQPGTGPGQMGPVIDPASQKKIVAYIEAAEKDGAKVLLDGRSWIGSKEVVAGGNWIGPTILLHSSSADKTMQDEVFGPVLSIYECASWEEAIQIENASDFGNAASVYTTNGANAEWFTSRFRASMLGVNIGTSRVGALYGCFNIV